MEEESEANRKTELNPYETFSLGLLGNTGKDALGAVGDKSRRKIWNKYYKMLPLPRLSQ